MKSNLQRRIRRAWLAKKERIAEKKRKKAEAAEAAKKNRFGKKKRATVAPSTGPSVAPSAKASTKEPTTPKESPTKDPPKVSPSKVEFNETGVNLIITKQLLMDEEA